MVRRKTAVLLPVIISCFSYQSFAQQRGGNPSQPPQQQQLPGGRAEQGGQPAPPAREETAGPNEEKISTTSHAIRLDGRDIKYTATTGTLPIRGEDGKVAARMFFVAYTRDGEDVKTRPISFLYNGGPGAATVWLHMFIELFGVNPGTQIAELLTQPENSRRRTAVADSTRGSASRRLRRSP